MKIYNELKDKDIDINAKDIENKSPLHHAIINRFTFLTENIIANKVDVNSIDIYGNSYLHYAAINGDHHAIKILFEQGINSNHGNLNNETQFTIHLKQSNLTSELVLLYAKYNADLNYKLSTKINDK